MLSAWPKILPLECVAAPNISTLDIQAWLREAAAAVVRIDGMDTNFGQFVGEVRKGGDVSLPTCWLPTLAVSHLWQYAIVKWDDQGVTLERLFLVPVGNILLCAAFPNEGIPGRPKQQPQRQIRVLPPSQERKKKKSSPGSQPDPAATETPPDGPHVEAAEADVSSVGSSADSSLGGIPITNSEAIEYEYVNSGDEST